MKILISYLFCTKGGVETALVNRLKEVNTSLYEIDLLFFKDYGGLSMFHDWNGNVYIEEYAENIKKLIIDNHYDIVIAIDSKEILEMIKAIEYDGKIGLEVHTTYEEGLKYLGSEVIDSVDFIIVPSEYQKKLVQSKVNNKNIFILGNAVSGNLIYQPQCEFPYRKKIVLWVGRIDPHKNWKLFLKIASELSKLDDNLIFWVVGGLKSRVEEIKEFEEMIYELDLECKVRWIPQVDYQKMSEIYSLAANSGGCYISTSHNESFGMTVIEAMICRCPVIVHAVGSLKELVQEGRGLCLKNMEETKQIETMFHFINSPDREKIVNRAEKYVNENFSCKSIGLKFCKILDKVYDSGEEKNEI